MKQGTWEMSAGLGFKGVEAKTSRKMGGKNARLEGINEHPLWESEGGDLQASGLPAESSTEE